MTEVKTNCMGEIVALELYLILLHLATDNCFKSKNAFLGTHTQNRTMQDLLLWMGRDEKLSSLSLLCPVARTPYFVERTIKTIGSG